MLTILSPLSSLTYFKFKCTYMFRSVLTLFSSLVAFLIRCIAVPLLSFPNVISAAVLTQWDGLQANNRNAFANSQDGILFYMSLIQKSSVPSMHRANSLLSDYRPRWCRKRITKVNSQYCASTYSCETQCHSQFQSPGRHINENSISETF